MNRWLVTAFLLLGAFMPGPAARAAITAVTVTPPNTTAVVGQPAQVLITWHVSSTLASPINSIQGRFTSPDGSILLGVNGTALHGNTTSSPGTAAIAEGLLIPVGVLQAAAAQGLTGIAYARSFSDDNPAAPSAGIGSLLVQLATPSVIAAAASPAQFTATLQAGGRIDTTWTVTGNVAGMAVRSTSGMFVLGPGGPVLQTVPVPLAAGLAGSAAHMRESLQVPVAVVYQALAAHSGVFYYVRHFEPVAGGVGADALIAIRIGGSSAGPLALARLSLRFDDGSRRRVLAPRQPLRALAGVQYTGGGLLQAIWEIAEPPGTSGQAVFRPLEFVRQYLLPGGHATLQSPPLPAEEAGRYVLRLRVQSPQLGDQDVLAVEYHVNPAMAEPAPRPRPLRVYAPAGNAPLEIATRFAWQPVSGAQAYRIEFHSADALPGLQPPQGGMLVSAATTRLQLSALARAHLRSGHSYRWRVLALGADGQVLAESGRRELVVP